MHSGVSVRGRREIPDQRAEPSTSACCLTSAPGGKRERESGKYGGIHRGHEDNDDHGGACRHIILTAFYARCVRHLRKGKKNKASFYHRVLIMAPGLLFPMMNN